MRRVLSLALVVPMLGAPLFEAHAAEPVPLTPAPAAQPTPAPTVTPPADEATAAKIARARTMKVWGGVSLATGLAFVAVSGITWGLRNTALRRADRRKYYVDEQRLIERARRRQVTAVVGLGVGAGLTVLGTGLLIAGASMAASARRRAVVVPSLGPGYAGVGATLRF